LDTSVAGDGPTVIGVVFERSGDDITGSEAFRFIGDAQQDFPQQLASLSSALEAKLPQITADAVVVRSMDHSPFNRREATQASRYAVEGVLLAVCRRRVEETQRLRGVEIGNRCGITKQQAEDRASHVCGAQLKGAGAAALAALLIAEGS
jgi:hypothetical protein